MSEVDGKHYLLTCGEPGVCVGPFDSESAARDGLWKYFEETTNAKAKDPCVESKSQTPKIRLVCSDGIDVEDLACKVQRRGMDGENKFGQTLPGQGPGTKGR